MNKYSFSLVAIATQVAVQGMSWWNRYWCMTPCTDILWSVNYAQAFVSSLEPLRTEVTISFNLQPLCNFTITTTETR